MSKALLSAVRDKYPVYRDWSDADLTLAIGRKYPAYLKDEQFADDYFAREKQEEFAKEADANRGTKGFLRNLPDAVAQEAKDWRDAVLGGSAEDWKRAARPVLEQFTEAFKASPSQALGLPSGGKILKETGRLSGEDAEKLTDALGMAPDRLPAEIIKGTAEALPTMAVATAGGAAGIPPPLAWAVPTWEKSMEESGGDVGRAAKETSIAMLMPGVSEFGGGMGERAAARVARVLSPAAQRAAAALGRVVGSQSLLSALQIAGDAPDLMDLAERDPKRAREELIKIVGGNLAFELPHLPGIAREAFARDHVDAYLGSPEYRRAVDQEVEARRAYGTREVVPPEMDAAEKQSQGLLEAGDLVGEEKAPPEAAAPPPAPPARPPTEAYFADDEGIEQAPLAADVSGKEPSEPSGPPPSGERPPDAGQTDAPPAAEQKPPVDAAPPGEQPAGEVADDSRQPGSNPPGVDDGQPAGTGAPTPPNEEAGGASGRQDAAGPEVRGPTEAGAGTERGGGVPDRAGADSGDTGRPGDSGGPRTDTATAGGAQGGVSEPGSPNDLNHILPADADWIPSGDKAKVRANLEAIKLLKQLEAENRNATPAEKEVLARYTGWGGVKQIFDEGKAAYRKSPPRWEEQKQEHENWEKSWGKLYDEVKAALTPQEHARAARSILNAHYTSREVVNGVWEGVRRLGFRGGKALEPAAGVGNFIGLTPESLRGKTQWRGVELDSTSARIAQKLYPQSRIEETGFEKSKVPMHSQDLVISNVPFDRDGPRDDRYPPLSLHNYFFVRGLDLLKPGGILAAITSDSTLDNPNAQKARELMAEKADFLGAIRLPNTAFKKNAGTEVTTDILFFRKKSSTPFKGEDFTRTTAGETYKGEPIELNEYFAKHPEMMLGRMSLEGTMRGPAQPALLPTPGADLNQQMKDAVAKLPADVFGAEAGGSEPAGVEGQAVAPKSAKMGQLTLDSSGNVRQVSGLGTLETPDWALDPKKSAQAKRYIGIRDTASELLRLQQLPETADADLVAGREKLNSLYDEYVKKHGRINERRSRFLDDDVDFPLTLALEDGHTRLVETPEGPLRQTEWTKSKLFTERTIFPRRPPERADTVADGLQISLNFAGRVDPEYIAKLTGFPVEAVQAELRKLGTAFENPASGLWEGRSQYLSGDVKTKLAEAQRASADDPRFAGNVAELAKVQPPSIPINQIGVRLGSPWVPPPVIEKFLREVVGVDTEVSRTEETGDWHVVPKSGSQSERNRTVFGIHGWAGHEIVGSALNLKSPVVTKSEPADNGGTREVKDPVGTLEVAQKLAELQAKFKEFLLNDPAVAGELEQVYNAKYNNLVSPKFDPPTWEHYPGAVQDITLREHQKAVVTRMLQNSTLLAHAVGTGKTFAMVTAAMEMRRMGMAKKPMIVVQNATLEQFARSFKRLYPGAKILAPNSKMRDATNRNRTMSRIATGDWDAVIIPQSFVNMLPDDPARERKYIDDRLADLQRALIEARAEGGQKAPKAADLQRAIRKLEERLDELADRQKDNVLTFEQLGVDALFVDEAHAYKKLEFSTAMDNIKGLDKGASQRGFSMLMKVRHVQEQNQGRNVIFATGTPVSNTIAEAWTMMRYLRPDLLKKFGMEDFDSFAGTFGSTVTQTEMTAGGTFKTVTRFASFQNGPELIAAWRTTADVVTADEINLPGLPALKNGRPTAVVIKQTPALKNYVQFLRSELDRFAAMSGREKRDNSHIPITVFTLAKKASLDMRMIDPSLPDEPGSKLNVASDRIAQAYHESTPVKGAQMVFADLYQDNPKTPRFNLYQEVKRKLVERGVPAEQIAIMTADIKDAKREALIERFREGEVRVLLGSTEKMGVGVNAQDRIVGLHHLDAPARPMDIEQRNGRAIRQGNQNPVVELSTYGVENTLDAAMYQMLATKQKFINQILRGDLQGRNFEDAANELSMSFEEQMAAFSGDPRAMQKVGLENQVRQLQSLRSGHHEQLRKARETLIDLKTRQIPFNENQIHKADAEVAKLNAAFPPDFEPVVTIYKKTATGRKASVEALDKFFKEEVEEADAAAKKNNQFGEAKGPARGITLNGQNVYLHVRVPADEKGVRQPDLATVDWRLGDGAGGTVRTGQGFFSSLAGVLENRRREPAWQRESMASKLRNVTELEGFVKQPFEREAELADARSKLNSLTAELEAEGRAKPPVDEGGEGGGGGEPLQAPQVATLPRNIQPSAGMEPGDPVALADIRRYLAKSLDVPVRNRGFRQRALGIFKPKAEVIRLKSFNDVPTLIHELGHYYHQLLFGNSTFQGAFDGELLALGAATSRASYSKKQIRMEGVAEFTREYLINPAQALAKAPGFTAHFEMELQTKYPETWAVVKRAQADIARYINQPAQARVRSMISRDPSVYKGPWLERMRANLDRAYARWVNNLDPIKRSMDYLQRLGLPAGTAQATTDYAVNYIGGWRGKVEHTLHYRQTDLAGTDVGPGLRQILAGVESLEDLGDYLVSVRAVEKNSQGKRTGIDSRDAQAVVQQFRAKYGPVADKLRDFQDNNLSLLAESGILSPKDILTMRMANMDYVPFYRVMEGPAAAGQGPKGGKGFVNGPRGVGRFKGDDRQIVDPLESIVSNSYLFRDLAERNQVGAQFVRAVNQTQGGGRLADQIPQKIVPTEVHHEEVIKALEKAGVDTQALGLAQLNLATTIWRAANRQREPVNGIFTVWEKGREVRYQLDDPELYKALSLSDGSDSRMANNFLGQGLAKVASSLRAGAVLSPEFMVRNPIRDQFTAAVFARGGYIPFWDGAKGLYHVLRRDDLYQAWLKSGGAHSHLTAMDRPNLREALADVVKDPAALRQALDWANPVNVLKNLAAVSRVMEEGTRVQAFQRAKEAGLSNVQAANASKEATLNFARGGEIGRWLNKYAAFFNASVQDLDLFMRMHDPRNPKQLGRIAAKAFFYVTAPSLMAWWLGKDDEAIQNLPTWRRNFFWNVNVGRMLKRGDLVLSLPKPFLLGQAYGSSVERALDFATKRDPNAVQKWFAGTLNTTPFTFEQWIPTAAKPVAEWWANKSFFRGQPLESDTMQRVPANLRFTPASSVLSRTVSDLLPEDWGGSPVKIDNTLRGVFGGLGKYGTDAIDWGLVKLGVQDVPPQAAKGLGEMPVVRAFTQSPYAPSIFVERWYQAAKEAEQLVEGARKAPQVLASAAQDKWFEKNRAELSHYLSGEPQTIITRVRQTSRTLADIHKAMTIAQTDPDMNPAAKRARLIELSKLRDQVAENGYKALISPAGQRSHF